MSTIPKRRGARALLEYSVHSRSDKPPRIGDVMRLGKQDFEVTALHVRVELRRIQDDESEDTEEA
jgi:hypothetical protein